jgi:hypothetical protein
MTTKMTSLMNQYNFRNNIFSPGGWEKGEDIENRSTMYMHTEVGQKKKLN